VKRAASDEDQALPDAAFVAVRRWFVCVHAVSGTTVRHLHLALTAKVGGGVARRVNGTCAPGEGSPERRGWLLDRDEQFLNAHERRMMVRAKATLDRCGSVVSTTGEAVG